MKMFTEAELEALLVKAYEAGYEQCANDGAADYPKDDKDTSKHICAIMTELNGESVSPYAKS